MMDLQFVISSGNAFEGITLHGPFDTYEEAMEVAENGRYGMQEWNIIDLNPVKDLV